MDLEQYAKTYGTHALRELKPYAPTEACLVIALGAIIGSYMTTRPLMGAALAGALWLRAQMETL